MIIMLRETDRHKSHRPRTITAAVAKIIDTSITGEPVVVDKMVDAFGEKIENNAIRMLIARLCRKQKIEYMTRTGDSGEFIFVRYS